MTRRSLKTWTCSTALLALVTGISLSGCSKEKDNPAAPVTTPDTVRFLTQISPLFQARCAPCHTQDPRSSGLDLATYNGVMTGGQRAPNRAVVPDSASVSFLITKLKGPQDTVSQGTRMPYGGPPYLSADSIALIEKWINQGAKNN